LTKVKPFHFLLKLVFCGWHGTKWLQTIKLLYLNRLSDLLWLFSRWVKTKTDLAEK
jgi:hypothetical protein